MKLFFSKYKNFVTGIKLYDNNKNEFTLKARILKTQGNGLNSLLFFMCRLKYSEKEKLVSRITGNMIIICLY